MIAVDAKTHVGAVKLNGFFKKLITS